MTRAYGWCLATAACLCGPLAAIAEDDEGASVYRSLFPFSKAESREIQTVAHEAEVTVVPQEAPIAQAPPPEGPFAPVSAGGNSCNGGANCGAGGWGGRVYEPRPCWVNDQYEPEWHVNAMIGTNLPQKEDMRLSSNLLEVDPNGGPQGAMAVGWASGPTWLGRRRVEAELGFRGNKIDNVTLNGVVTNTEAHMHVTSAMVNVLWDFKQPDRAWYPYIGGGAGVAVMSLHPGGSAFEDTEAKDAVFAYQFIGGISWRLRSYLELFAEARYFGTGDAEIEGATNAIVLPGAALAAGNQTLVGEYHSFGTLVGCRIILGKRRCDDRPRSTDGRPTSGSTGWHFTPY